MDLHIFKSKKEASLYASAKIIHQIKNKPNSVLGLSTGKTMIPIYKDIVYGYKNHLVDFTKVKTFNVDEYANIDKKNKNSFYNYMVKNIFSKINIKKSNFNFPDKNNFHRYDYLIKKSGGLDLLILGLGRNGHIAFNEPGKSSKINSKTRLINLSSETIKFNKLKSKNITKSYTIGISTILKAKKIIIVAFDNDKSKAVYNLVNGKISHEIPSTFLRHHPDCIFILDKKASKLL